MQNMLRKYKRNKSVQPTSMGDCESQKIKFFRHNNKSTKNLVMARVRSQSSHFGAENILVGAKNQLNFLIFYVIASQT